MPRRLSPAGVAMIYAGFAGVWIIASGYLLTLTIADPVLLALFELGKGLAFVAVTSVVLYKLLRRCGESAGDVASASHEQNGGPQKYRLILLFVGMALVVPLIGWTIVAIHVPQTERDTYANLQAVARLKSGQIENWLDERRGDATSLANDEAFAALVARFRHGNKDAKLSGQILRRFEMLRSIYKYDSILLLDETGRVLLAAGEHTDIPKEMQQLSQQALSLNQAQHGELFRDKTGHVNLDWVVPVIASGKQGESALVVLRTVPDHFLFPLIQTWPTVSVSAETLLARGEGDYVVFLNELRHRKGTALNLKLPLSSPALPAAIAVRANKPGTIRGLDHRGVEVLATYQPVAGTNWRLIAKIDRTEVMMPVWQMVYWIGLVAFSAVALITATMLQIWRQQRYAHQLALRVRSVEAVEQNERRFRAVTQSANDAIITADRNGNIVAWNPAAERTFGYTADEVVGQSLTVIIPERFRERHSAGMARVAAGGETHLIGQTAELAGQRKDGSEFPLELSLSQWQTAEGWFCSAIIRDISERKQVEAKLATSELRYRRLFESAQDGILILDAETGVIEDANPFLIGKLGYTTEEFIGKIIWELGILKDVPASQEHFAGLQQKGHLRCADMLLVAVGGGLLHVDCIGSSYLVGTHKVVQCNMRDITERKAAEQQFQTLQLRTQHYLNVVNVMLLVLDAQGRVQLINRMGCEMLGYAEADILGKNWFESFIPERTRKEVTEFYAQFMSGNIDLIEHFEHVVLTSAGERFFAWHNSVLLDDAGEIDGVISSAEDITERKRLEKILRESEARYKRITDELTDYQYTVRIENGNAVEAIQSPACVTVTGYTPEEFSADPYLWIQMVAPEDRERVREHVQQVLQGKEVEPIEHSIIRKDGELRWVKDTTIPLRDVSGNLLSYDGVIKDITERKQTEFELAEQLDELRRWHDTTMGRETRILDLKHEVNELLGRAGQPPRYPSAESPG